MKQFKLNAFEKFVIRHKKAVNILSYFFFFCAVIIIAICDNFITIPIDGFIPFVLFLACQIYIVLMPALKNQRIMKAHGNLEINYALDGATKLAQAVNLRDTVNASLFSNNKTAFLIEAGKFEDAQEEIKRFFQVFDTRKLDPSTLFAIHFNYAIIKLSCGDEEAYKEQFCIVKSYYDKIKGSKLKLIIATADKNFNNLLINETARFGAYSEDFEQRVLNDFQVFNCNKKKSPRPLDYFDMYFALFVYFKRFNNTEKATHYAREAVKIGNSELYNYRIAKEYLEHADRSN